MTLITFEDGKPVMKDDGKIGTEQACCCPPPPPECETDEDCPEGECCVDGVCGPCPCETDEDCPEGECCVDGVCGPCEEECSGACDSSEDCAPGCRCVFEGGVFTEPDPYESDPARTGACCEGASVFQVTFDFAGFVAGTCGNPGQPSCSQVVLLSDDCPDGFAPGDGENVDRSIEYHVICCVPENPLP